MIEVKLEEQFANSPHPVIHETEYPNWEARLVAALVERWGMVAGEPDGEDSAGRQKLRPSTPKELAQRACETGSEVAAELRKRKWFVAVPTLEEIKAEAERRKDRK